jgi:steroid 5-alpha reductase family enzyme
MKSSKFKSLLLILGIYIASGVVGFITFKILPEYSYLIRVLAGDVAATVFVFLGSLLIKNSSVYDPYWSVAPLIVLPLTAWYYNRFGVEVLILLGAVFFWGIRLTLNWIYTFTDFTYQDWRYVMLKEKSKQFYPIVNFCGIHLFPTLIVYGAMVPAILFIKDGSFSWLMLVGIAVSVVGTIFELIADYQMHTFKKTNTIKGKIIDVGLWKYSRHPNYLGEILMWWGVYLVMLSVLPQLWGALIGALANTLMFIFISIPMAETKLSKTKLNYEEYMKTTRMLLPIKK